MGNCVWRSFVAEDDEAIKVMTATGGVMEFDGPLTAQCITNDYPGHGIFRPGTVTSPPLPNNEELLNGELYYLLPLDHHRQGGLDLAGGHIDEEGFIDDHAAALPASSCRLSSCGGSDQLLPKISTHTISTVSKYKKPCMEMLPKHKNGVWRVKLVISPEQLTEILSEESNTEALIESVRTVAKCGSTAGGGPDQEGFKYSSSKSSEESATVEMDRGI